MMDYKITIEELQKTKAQRENNRDNLRFTISEREKKGMDCTDLLVKLKAEEFYIRQIETKIRSYQEEFNRLNENNHQSAT